VAKAALWLSTKGLAEVEERVRRKARLGEEGKLYAAEGLPERRLLNLLRDAGGSMKLKEAAERLGAKQLEIGLMWAKRREWIEVEKRDEEPWLKLLSEPPAETPEERVLALLAEGEKPFEELPPELRDACIELSRRPGVVELVEERVHFLKPTHALMELSEDALAVEEVTRLSRELLVTGRWRQVKFSRFDVKAPTRPVFAARRHPLHL